MPQQTSTEQITSANIALAVEQIAAQQPDTLAIAFPSKRGYIEATYRELLAASDAIAQGLGQIGIKRGTRCVLMVTPSLDFFALTFGLLRAGVVPVIVDPGMGLKNLKVCLDEAEPQAFIGLPKAHLARLALGWARDTLEIQVTVGRRLGWGGSTLEQIKALGAAQTKPFKTVDSTPDEMAAIIFTSGSTGVPKGVVYTHGNFKAQVALIQETFGMQAGEIDLPTFPVFALFDPAFGMATVVPQMDFTRPAKVDPAKLIATAAQYQPSNMFGSPALLNTVGRYGENQGAKLPSIRRVISAGAPVPPAVLRRFAAMLDPQATIHTPYGATEGLPIATITHQEILAETAALTAQGAGVCVGYPVKGVEVGIIKIDDEAIPHWSPNLTLAQGEIGEIVVKGANISREYYNRPRSTELAKIYTSEGGFYHRMGDVGYFDENGRLWYCGRKAHRVITSDETLFTIPAEGIFNSHAAVFRSALVGVSIKGKTEPIIIIQLEADQPKPDLETLRAELLSLAENFPQTRTIKRLLYHDDFPVDVRHNAKIFREKLAVWAERQLARGKAS